VILNINRAMFYIKNRTIDNVQKRNICTNVRSSQFLEDIIVCLVKDRNQWHGFVKMATNVRIPLKMENFLTSCATVIFSKGTVLH
jgi:hypothetical protein